MRGVLIAVGIGLLVAGAPLLLDARTASAVLAPLQSGWPFPGSSFANACTGIGSAASLALHHLTTSAVCLVVLAELAIRIGRSTSTVDLSLDPNTPLVQWAVRTFAVVLIGFYAAPLFIDFLPGMESCNTGSSARLKAAFMLFGASVLYMANRFVIWATSKPKN